MAGEDFSSRVVVSPLKLISQESLLRPDSTTNRRLPQNLYVDFDPFRDNGIFYVPLDYSLVDKCCQALFYNQMWIAIIWLKIRVIQKSRTAF